MTSNRGGIPQISNVVRKHVFSSTGPNFGVEMQCRARESDHHRRQGLVLIGKMGCVLQFISYRWILLTRKPAAHISYTAKAVSNIWCASGTSHHVACQVARDQARSARVACLRVKSVQVTPRLSRKQKREHK